MIPWLSLLLGSALTAGANAYLTILAIGLYSRFGDATAPMQETIAPFASYWVIVPAGILFLVEFLADKVPALDNLWDALHTVIRPVAAILIALTLARDIDTAYQIMAAFGSGSIALGSHSLKAGVRGLARLNPEPASNALSSSALSFAEDLSVAGILILVFFLPGLALVLVGALLIVVFFVGPRLVRIGVFSFRAATLRLIKPFMRRRDQVFGASALPLWALDVLGAKDGMSDIEWWNRCYLDYGGFLDYHPGIIVVGSKSIATLDRKWFRAKARVIPLDAIKKSALVHGPLVNRIVIESEEGKARVLLFSVEKMAVSLLVEKLPS